MISTEFLTDVAGYLLRFPIVLIALTVHEYSHGYMAYRLGDSTAKDMGRLTLNPFKHIDPIGFICMLLFRFGWAKPVPIGARNFKKPKRDMALTALAGPVSNLIMSFISFIIFRAAYKLILIYGSTDSTFVYYVEYLLLNFLQLFYILNLSLAIFNLIPIPPLDGSRLLLAVLPTKLYFGIMKYERYIMLAMMVLLFTGVISQPLTYLLNLILRGYSFVADLIPFLAI